MFVIYNEDIVILSVGKIVVKRVIKIDSRSKKYTSKKLSFLQKLEATLSR